MVKYKPVSKLVLEWYVWYKRSTEEVKTHIQNSARCNEYYFNCRCCHDHFALGNNPHPPALVAAAAAARPFKPPSPRCAVWINLYHNQTQVTQASLISQEARVSPDSLVKISPLARFLSTPSLQRWTATKDVFGYLKKSAKHTWPNIPLIWTNHG